MPWLSVYLKDSQATPLERGERKAKSDASI